MHTSITRGVHTTKSLASCTVVSIPLCARAAGYAASARSVGSGSRVGHRNRFGSHMGGARDASSSLQVKERNKKAAVAAASVKDDALRFGEVDLNGDQELDL